MKQLMMLTAMAFMMAFTACNESEVQCYSFPATDEVIPIQCTKCFDTDEDYSDWFERCWHHALFDPNNLEELQQAVDAVCACE